MTPRVKIVCHDCSPRWVSWGYVITWPDGSTEMMMSLSSLDRAEKMAAAAIRRRSATHDGASRATEDA